MDWQRIHRPGPCIVCHTAGVRMSSLHDWHLVSVCCGQAVRAVRATVVPEMPGLCERILRAIRRALKRAVFDENADGPDTQLDTDCRTMRETLLAVDWTSLHGQALLHRLVTVQTWSATDVPPVAPDAGVDQDPAHRILVQLGLEFDRTVVQPRLLRPLADLWCLWAVERFERLSLAWAEDAVLCDPALHVSLEWPVE